MDYRLALMCGTSLPIPSCTLDAHQPTIKEISYMGEGDFFMGTQCLCLSKTMFIKDKNVLDQVSNFQIFMKIMLDKESIDKKNSVAQVLTLLFPSHKPLFTPNSLILQGQDAMITIDEGNFEDLQEVLKLIFCAQNGSMDQQAFNPANDKAREIAEKLMRGRQRIAEERGNSNSSVFSQYISVLTVGLSISPLELQNLTMFQLYDLMERYSLYLGWDIDIKSRLAGAKGDKPVEDWMKNLHQ